MGGAFDNKGSGAEAGKRPTPTIEGTATEISVESAEAGATKEPKSEVESEVEPKDDTDAAPSDDEDGDDGEPTVDESSGPDEPHEPTAAEITAKRNSGGRSLASVLLATLTSFLTHAIAGLIGGVAVLFAISWGYLPLGGKTETPDLAPLEDRIAKLEAAPETPDSSEALAKLETRLGDLETKASETSPEVAALSDRVAQLEASLKSMAEAAKDGGSVADAAAISQQINEAEKRLDAKIDQALAEAKTATGADTTDTAAIDALKKELAEIDAKLKALTEAELGSGDASQLLPEVAALDERVNKIETALPSLIEALDEDSAETKTATLAIAFANLRAAVDAGRPYEDELGILAKLSPGAGDLGRLLDYEDTGIPTLRELTASFETARKEALAMQEPADDASIIDRLMSSAESLVTVRRIDEAAEGDGPDAVLARAAAKLKQGDLAAAVTEVETLQGGPRAAYVKWLDAAKARLDAEETLQHLQNILLVSLGGGGTDSVDETQE